MNLDKIEQVIFFILTLALCFIQYLLIDHKIVDAIISHNYVVLFFIIMLIILTIGDVWLLIIIYKAFRDKRIYIFGLKNFSLISYKNKNEKIINYLVFWAYIIIALVAIVFSLYGSYVCIIKSIINNNI